MSETGAEPMASDAAVLSAPFATEELKSRLFWATAFLVAYFPLLILRRMWHSALLHSIRFALLAYPIAHAMIDFSVLVWLTAASLAALALSAIGRKFLPLRGT